MLPTEIQEVFFDTLNEEKTILEFEQWLYADTQLENVLNEEDYLELISFGYKEENAKYYLSKMLEKHIDKGEFETRRIYKLLLRALERDKELPQILMIFYDLYCKGYQFFDNLGLGYGLSVEIPSVKNSLAENWDELNNNEQNNLLNSFYPKLETEIKKVISWLDAKKLILKGVKDDHNQYDYIDNRTEFERLPTAYQIHPVENNKSSWHLW